MRACLENFYLEVEIEEEGAFPLHFQGEMYSILGEFLVSIFRLVVTEIFFLL
jgi:hypothetical protein